jgi:hypothetical protein
VRLLLGEFEAVLQVIDTSNCTKTESPPEINEQELVASMARCVQLTDVPRRAWRRLLSYFGPFKEDSAELLRNVRILRSSFNQTSVNLAPRLRRR